MKLDMGSATVGGSAGFEAVIGARDVKWYKGHYLKLNALLVCSELLPARIKLRPNSFCWS
jgi:hypothetical protein